MEEHRIMADPLKASAAIATCIVLSFLTWKSFQLGYPVMGVIFLLIAAVFLYILFLSFYIMHLLLYLHLLMLYSNNLNHYYSNNILHLNNCLNLPFHKYNDDSYLV